MSFESFVSQANKPLAIEILSFAGTLETEMAAEFADAGNWSVAGDASGVDVETVEALGLDGVLTFDKDAGGTTGGYYNGSLPAVTLANFAYETLRVRHADWTNLSHLIIRRGSDASNFYQWTIDASNLEAGEFSTVYLSRSAIRSGDTYQGESGTVGATLDYFLIHAVTAGSGDALAGILVSPLRQHPYRYSTSEVTDPVADTLPWLAHPQVTGADHDPRTGTLKLDQAAALVVDVDGRLLADISRFPMEGRECELFYGFAGESETPANYVRGFHGQVNTYPNTGKSFTFGLYGPGAFLRRPFAANATAASPLVVSGTPAAVALTLAASTGKGSNGAYDTLAAGDGAGIDAEVFDVEEMEAQESVYRSWCDLEFTFVEPEPNFLAWFAAEIARGCALSPRVTNTSRVSFVAVESQVYPGASEYTLDGSTVIVDSLPGQTPDYQRVRNRVRGKYLWNAETGEFEADTGDAFQLAESVAKYGPKEMEVFSKGIRSALVMERVATAHLYRLGDGSPPITLAVLPTQWGIALGDLPTVSHGLLADLEAGEYGLDGLAAEVEAAGYSPADPAVLLRLGGTGYRRGNFRRIAPNGTSAYTSQTAAQKARYGSLADGTTQKLDGGADDPHRLGP